MAHARNAVSKSSNTFNTMETTRRPQFAGKFYPLEEGAIAELLDQIDRTEAPYFESFPKDFLLIGGIVPHAGYVFSAFQAVHFFKLLKECKRENNQTVVFINPNHTGHGIDSANWCGFQKWQIPGGTFEIDAELAETMGLTAYEEAHINEHSTEVLLPMLAHFNGFSSKILPITMNRQTPEVAEQLAQTLKNASEALGRRLLVIASSDFSHYEAPEVGYAQDQFMVDAILKLNSAELYAQVKKHHISACGYGPIMTLIEYAKNSTTNPVAKILKRGHSGQVMPSKQVVDYISFALLHKSISKVTE